MVTTEVALLFPSLEVASSPYTCCSGIFCVDVSNKALVPKDEHQRIKQQHENNFTNEINSGRLGAEESFLRGTASISSVVTSNNQRANITTSVCVDAREILNVALILEDDDSNVRDVAASSQSKLLRLDWSCSEQFGPIVSVQAFASGLGRVDLVVVDTNGCIVVVAIDVDNWTPKIDIPLRVLNVPSLLAIQWPESGKLRTTFGLTQERVSFLDKNRILLATNPLLLAVDITEGRIAAWSLQQARNPSKSSTTSTIYSRIIGGMFLGSTSATDNHAFFPSSDNPVDMDPILSLCTADNDYTTIFTFHSGGVLRRWHCLGGHCLLPDAVQDIILDDLPPDEDWSDEPVRMVAHSYDSGSFKMGGDDDDDDTGDVVCSAAIYIQTALPPLNFDSGNNNTTPRPHFFRDDNENGDFDAEENFAPSFGGSRLIVAVAGGSSSVGGGGGFSVSHAVRLPDGPSALVGAAFVGNTPSLTALIAKDGATALLRYHPVEVAVEQSMTSSLIVQAVPEIVFQHGSFDYVAQQELWCIEYLISPATMSLHDLDVRYLQYLFRPKACRGVGHSLPPSASRIRTALQKCFPQYRVIKSTQQQNSSIYMAMEVVKALHQWRISQSSAPAASSMSLVPVSVQTPGGAYTSRSFYDSLQLQEQIDLMQSDPEETFNVDEGTETRENVSIQELEEYEQLWQQLLTQIWREECLDRIPLAFSPYNGILLRSGLVSNIFSNPPYTEPENILDQVAKRMMNKMEENGDLALKLYLQEQKMTLAFSNLTEDISIAAKDVATDLSALALDCRHLVMSDNEFYRLEQSLSNSIEFWIRQVQLVGSDSVARSSGEWSSGSFPSNNDSESSWRLLSVQDRLAASSLCLRRLDEIRQLFLGRYLVLCGLIAHESISEAAWLGYLRALSLLLASSQNVPNTCLTKSHVPTNSIEEDEVSPPKKRPSFDSSLSDSILISTGVADSTTSLDSFLVSIYREMDFGHGDDEFVYLPATSQRLHRLVQKAVRLMFATRSPTIPTQETMFPEVQFILPSVSTGVVTEQPKLTLTLLAPFLAVASANEDPAVQEARLEATAECLLLLSRNYPDTAAALMENRAFEILRFEVSDLAEGLRRMSKLRQHAVGSARLVECIDKAIDAVRGQYSEEDLAESSDFAKLVSMMFYKALEACDWDKALKACRNDPNRKQRLDHLQRLVTAMVDAGALSNLVALCSSQGEDTEQHEHARGMDLYGVAVETLGKAGYRDWYTHRASGSESLSDYQGALYALHESRGEWKRASQALDLRYANAATALARDTALLMNGFALDSATASKRTRLILDDLVLAATGGHDALCLVDSEESQFIISGENGKFRTLPCIVTGEDKVHVLKRPRDQVLNRDSNDREEEMASASEHVDEYRLARYKDRQDLQTRAIVAIAVRRLWIDRVIEKPLAELLLSEKEESGRGVELLIRELFKSGHYDIGLVLASQVNATLPGRLEGRGIFQEALSFLICDHLVPLAIGLEGLSKPSLAQILTTLDAVSGTHTPPVLLGRSPGKRENPLDSSIWFAAMTLLERVTTKYTTAETPLAKELADCFITEHKLAALPQWLVSLLTCGSDPRNQAPGLFAKRPEKGSSIYLGDPCALLNIYIMAGMYHLACGLVSSVLDIAGQKPNATAMRLPEKGNMDFVPYEKIDILYNLIDTAVENGDLEDGEFRETVLLARSRMVESLEAYFDRMEVSEAGLRSARILASG
ncbi:hypothetical protein ACA910_016770 [Epithemia clementina (nom. ined.)]